MSSVGHVTHTPHICYLMVTLKETTRGGGQRRDGWTMWQKTVKCYNCHLLMPTDLHTTGPQWRTIIRNWEDGAARVCWYISFAVAFRQVSRATTCSQSATTCSAWLYSLANSHQRLRLGGSSATHISKHRLSVCNINTVLRTQPNTGREGLADRLLRLLHFCKITLGSTTGVVTIK